MMPQFLLLPGMDGTGELFAEFVAALPVDARKRAVCLPADVFLSYEQLMKVVKANAPEDAPFVLIAESFSTPLAIQYAATNPSNLKALILCAGFASSPLIGWRGAFAGLIAPILFRVPISDAAIKCFLVGQDAPPELIASVRAAIGKVRPDVLASRLRQVLGRDVLAELARIQIPILYIRATADRLIPQRCAEEIGRIQPSAKSVDVAGPHLILQRQPTAAALAISNFLSLIGVVA